MRTSERKRREREGGREGEDDWRRERERGERERKKERRARESVFSSFAHRANRRILDRLGRSGVMS